MTLKELFGAHFCGNFSMPGEIQRMVSIQKGQAILMREFQATHPSFTPISSDTKGATSASGETRQYRDIGTGLESPKST